MSTGEELRKVCMSMEETEVPDDWGMAKWSRRSVSAVPATVAGLLEVAVAPTPLASFVAIV